MPPFLSHLDIGSDIQDEECNHLVERRISIRKDLPSNKILHNTNHLTWKAEGFLPLRVSASASQTSSLSLADIFPIPSLKQYGFPDILCFPPARSRFLYEQSDRVTVRISDARRRIAKFQSLAVGMQQCLGIVNSVINLSSLSDLQCRALFRILLRKPSPSRWCSRNTSLHAPSSCQRSLCYRTSPFLVGYSWKCDPVESFPSKKEVILSAEAGGGAK